VFRIHKLDCTLHFVSRVRLIQCFCTITPGGQNLQFVLLTSPDLQFIYTIISGCENLQFVLLTYKASPDLQFICIIISGGENL